MNSLQLRDPPREQRRASRWQYSSSPFGSASTCMLPLSEQLEEVDVQPRCLAVIAIEFFG